MTAIEGYAVVWDSPSEVIGGDAAGFVEIVKRGAFKNTLRERDALALHSHNADLVLGRMSSRTLELREDERGLYFRVDLPDSQLVDGMVVQPVRRRDIQGMSFGFNVRPNGERWSLRSGRDIRELTDLTLYEVSTTGMPAYPATSVAIAGTEPQSMAPTRTSTVGPIVPAPKRSAAPRPTMTVADLSRALLIRQRRFLASISAR
jgi:Escherichia/Staphylococcus phage prohead protease